MSNQHDSHLDEGRFFEYLDDILEAHVRDEVEKHLSSCAACSERLRNTRSLFDTIASLDDEPIGRDISPIVMSAILPRNSAIRMNRIAVAIQLLVLGIVAAVLWSNIRNVLEQWVVSPLGIEFVTSLQKIQIELPRLWEAWMSALSDILVDASNLVTRVPLPLLPQFDGVEILLLVLISWLVINGFLLRASAASTFLRRPQ